MKDSATVSNMRFQLHDLRDELIGVRMRIMPGARTAAIERARQHLQDACAELETVIGGRLQGDGATADPLGKPGTTFDLPGKPTWIGLDLARGADRA